MKIRLIVTTAILAATAWATVFFETHQEQVDNTRHSYAQRIPLQLGDWKGMDLEVTNSTRETLGTDDLLMRVYQNSEGEEIVFAAVFAENNRRATHPPEICYRGQGFFVEKMGPVSYPVQSSANGFIPPADEAQHQNKTAENQKLQQAQAKVQELPQKIDLAEPHDFAFTELIIRREGERRLVHYWYKTGHLTTNSTLLHEWHMLQNNIASRNASNSLLRVSTAVKSPSAEDIQAARKRVEEFSKAVYPYTMAAMP